MSDNVIRDVLAITGWSQAELGRRVGVHKDTVQDWVQGRFQPRPGVYADLRKVLEAQRDELGRLIAHWQTPARDEPRCDV